MPIQDEVLSYPELTISHPELRAIAKDVLQGLQYSFLAAAARHDSPFHGSIEEEFRRAILSRPQAQRTGLREHAANLASAPTRARQAMFGRYGALELDAYGDLGFASAATKLAPRRFDHAALAAAVRHVHEVRSLARSASELESQTRKLRKKPNLKFPAVKAIRFCITEVKCDDETDGFAGLETGDDEILLGGIAVDESGNASKIPPFTVGNEFDDGERVIYSAPGREFCRFDARHGSDWPKTYSAIVIMAEGDWGGFVGGVNNAFAIAAPEIKKRVQAAIHDIAEPFVGDFLAEWAGKLVAWIAENLVRWIVDIFADDIFKPGTAVGGLHTPLGWAYQNAPGWTNYASPPGAFTFVGHGGRYTVKCCWRVEV